MKETGKKEADLSLHNAWMQIKAVISARKSHELVYQAQDSREEDNTQCAF